MSEYGQMIDQLSDGNQVVDEVKQELSEQVEVTDELFTVDRFVENLSINTAEKNKKYATRPVQNISGYDIASGCIRNVYYRVSGVPLKSYRDIWLPVAMRGVIGNAVHDFIQANFNFTEVEKSMRVPSINFSGRYDWTIGNHTLGEIKTTPYIGDMGYQNIIKTQQARVADFYQVLAYKYVLENFLEEMKSQPREGLRTDPPGLDKYDIKHIQFIYVAHDIISADCESISDNKAIIAAFKRELKSGKNKFSFMTCITYDLTRVPNLNEYMDYIETKFEDINTHLKSNKLPPMSNPHINKKACFFCKYKDQCKTDGE